MNSRVENVRHPRGSAATNAGEAARRDADAHRRGKYRRRTILAMPYAPSSASASPLFRVLVAAAEMLHDARGDRIFTRRQKPGQRQREQRATRRPASRRSPQKEEFQGQTAHLPLMQAEYHRNRHGQPDANQRSRRASATKRGQQCRDDDDAADDNGARLKSRRWLRPARSDRACYSMCGRQPPYAQHDAQLREEHHGADAA